MSNLEALSVTLLLPRKKKDRTLYARAVFTHLLNNKDFPNLSYPIAQFDKDVEELEKADAAAASHTKGAAKLRDAKAAKVMQVLWHYVDDVQRVIEVQPSRHDAAVIAEGAHMGLRSESKRTRAPVTATCADVSGCVVVDAKAVAYQAIYFWQYSEDQETWTSVPESFRTKVVISGLTPGKRYYFRFRAHGRKEKFDFSQVVSLIVV